MTLRLGIVGTLPGVATGPADNLGYVLPELASRCRLVCYVPDVAVVSPALRERYDVRAIDDLDPSAADIFIYQVANNPLQEPVNRAAREGPPGLVEVHDGSQHHLLAHLTQERGRLSEYRSALVEAHGEAGGRLADLRGEGPGFQLEHMVFDALSPLLRRHRGAIVHNLWAAGLVERRCPGLPTWVSPIPAPPPRPAGRVDRAALGLPRDAFVVGNFGFVTHPKRPLLLFDAFAQLCAAGVNGFLVYGGEVREGFQEAIADRAARTGLGDRVMMTGYLARERLDALLDAVDIVFNCRFPHLGESSGVMAESMAAGRALIVHPLGAWADVPDDCVVKVPMGAPAEEVNAVASAMQMLLDPGLRERVGAAARAYARTALSVEYAAETLLTAATEAFDGGLLPFDERLAAASERARAGLAEMVDPAGRAALAAVPTGINRPRMLLLGQAAWATAAEAATGYEVSVCTEPGTSLPYPAGEFAAVVGRGAEILSAPDPGGLLAEVNRVLRERGTCSLATDGTETATLQLLLDATGFSRLEIRGDALAGEKVALPGDRWPARLYADRWIEAMTRR